MHIRRPTFPEVICQIGFAGLAILLLLDFIDAASVRCDLAPESSWCSVWGGTEGPVGMAWNYRNQSIYLRSDIARIAILTIAILMPFVTPRPAWGMVLLSGVSILGMVALEFLGPMLL
jgi:hypothetical protein